MQPTRIGLEVNLRSVCLAISLSTSLMLGTAAWAKTDEKSSNLDNVQILQFGFGTPGDEFLKTHAHEMESWNPHFGHLVIRVQLRGQVEVTTGRKPWDGTFSWSGFGAKKITWANVTEAVENLKAANQAFARPGRMFLRFNVIPGNVDWFDDEGWEAIAHNASIAGRIVAEAPLAGLVFDVEEYGKPEYGQGKPFHYEHQLHSVSKTFEQYAVEARRRGRQFMEAFSQQAPETIVMFTLAHSRYVMREWRMQLAGDLQPDEPLAIAKSGKYGKGNLLAPYLDGMLEAAPPELQLFDGFEYSYTFKTEDDFARARQAIEEGYRFSQVPEVYKQKMKAAYGIEMDRFWHPRGGFFPNDPEKNFHTPKSLADALHWAMTYSDGLVWVYSEVPRFWPRKGWSGAYEQVFAESRKAEPFGTPPARTGGIVSEWKTNRGHRKIKAVELRGPDPETIFRGFWNDHEMLMDLPLEARFQIDPDAIGMDQGFATLDFDDSTWGTIRIDEFWQHQGFDSHYDVSWYRLRFEAPNPLPSSQKIFLAFGRSDEQSEIFLDGTSLFKWNSWHEPFLVDVTDYLRPGQEHLVVAKVFGGKGVGGLWAPIKLIATKPR